MSTSPDAPVRGRRGGMVQRAGFLQRMVPVTLLAVILLQTAQSHLRQLPGTRRAPCMSSPNLRLRGGSDPERGSSDMDSENFVDNMLERRAYQVDASEFQYDPDEPDLDDDDLFESPVAIADQETQVMFSI